METRILAFLLLFAPVGLIAQTSLTFSNNSLRNCDSNTYEEIVFTDPGTSGPNQTWDYSHIQYTGKNQGSVLVAATTPKIPGVSNFNLLMSENGYEYLMSATENGLEELGYVNNELKLTLLYSDPVVKMKYPFSFGNQFTDHFAGVALYNGTSKIDFYGDCAVSADAFGTLILPDRVVNGALRVKSVKKGLQINTCGTTDVNIVKYSWYATGYRYPLLSLNVVETSANGCSAVITKSAFSNTQQSYNKSGLLEANAKTSDAPTVKADIKVVISPNPFTDQLTFSYLLPEPLNVSIEVYDTSGKINGWLVQDQLQTAGLQTGELNASNYGLTPGLYFMRFTFDKQIVIHKIVKF